MTELVLFPQFNDAQGNPADVDTANADGTSLYMARRDHIHALANNVVTFAKLQDISANTLIGSAAGGDPAEIICTAFGRSLIDDAAASNARTTLGLGTMAVEAETNYALLAGRGGGQTLIGGTGTTDDLILRTTSGGGASGADLIFQVGNNGATEAMRILNSGNVGIGTMSPSEKLQVSGGGLFTGALGNFATSAAAIDFFGGATRFWAFGPNAATAGTLKLIVSSNNGSVYNEVIVADASLNVGIGTDTPGGKLDVRGMFSHFGQNGGNVWFNDNTLNFQNGTNATATGYLNYEGYNHGITQFRDLEIHNGKHGAIALFQGSTGNVGFQTTSQFGSGAGVLGIANATTNPSTNPTGGFVIYGDGGAGKGRGSGGTVSTFIPADPHCPVCGSDYAVEFDNPKFGYFTMCLRCLADFLGDMPWITRDKTRLTN